MFLSSPRICPGVIVGLPWTHAEARAQALNEQLRYSACCSQKGLFSSKTRVHPMSGIMCSQGGHRTAGQMAKTEAVPRIVTEGPSGTEAVPRIVIKGPSRNEVVPRWFRQCNRRSDPTQIVTAKAKDASSKPQQYLFKAPSFTTCIKQRRQINETRFPCQSEQPEMAPVNIRQAPRRQTFD